MRRRSKPGPRRWTSRIADNFGDTNLLVTNMAQASDLAKCLGGNSVALMNLLQRTRCYYFYDIATPCNKREPGSGCSAIAGLNRMHGILGTSEACIATHPSDMCVALAALDATIHVAGPAGAHAIAFSDFHRLPGDTPQRDTDLEPNAMVKAVRV